MATRLIDVLDSGGNVLDTFTETNDTVLSWDPKVIFPTLPSGTYTFVQRTGKTSSFNVPIPLFLDEFPGATAAFSLRKLRSATTAVVRVRRDSDNADQDFTETDILDGSLVAWVGAGNDGLVTTMYDQSGDANNVTQTTAKLQPKIVDSGALVTESGNPAISLAGGRYLTLPATAHSFSTSPNKTMITVAEISNTLGLKGRQVYWGVGVSTRITLIADINGSGFGYTFRGFNSIQEFSAPTSGIHLIFAQDLNGPTSLWLDGGLENSDNLGSTSTTDNAHLGANPASGDSYEGNISEVILYEADKSAERVAMQQNIANYYGIALS